MNGEPMDSPGDYPGDVEFVRAAFAPTEAPEPVKGGFFRRAAAYLMDLSLIDLLTLFFLFLNDTAVDLASGGGLQLVTPDRSQIESLMPLWTAVFTLYFVFFTYWGGQTPGKMILRLRVISLRDGEISFARALIRTFGYFLSYLSFFVGFLMAGFTPKKRALHDYLAGTRVIRTS